MTADIRTAAQRAGIVPSSRAEAEEKYAGFGAYKHAKVDSFIDGAVWGAARATPTREQIAMTVAQFFGVNDTPEDVADAILALLAGLAEKKND